MKCSLLLYRTYGQPKISKPKILKGLKPLWKEKVMQKPADVYALPDGDFVVYFGNLFSRLMYFPDPKDMSLPTTALMEKYPERFMEKGKKSFKGFVYADAWCPILERNEGYVMFEGIREKLKPTRRLFKNPYPPAVAFELENSFFSLSLLDSKFVLCNGTDTISSAYRRFLEDFVWKVFENERTAK